MRHLKSFRVFESVAPADEAEVKKASSDLANEIAKSAGINSKATLDQNGLPILKTEAEEQAFGEECMSELKRLLPAMDPTMRAKVKQELRDAGITLNESREYQYSKYSRYYEAAIKTIDLSKGELEEAANKASEMAGKLGALGLLLSVAGVITGGFGLLGTLKSEGTGSGPVTAWAQKGDYFLEGKEYLQPILIAAGVGLLVGAAISFYKAHKASGQADALRTQSRGAGKLKL
jgi:hypothetical protein